jgi:diazepam-binding inhibitor (GABA receptor modulator, acyl-CoA-binding protein)
MSELETLFTQYSERVKKVKNTPSDNELLELYALYKQSTVGDCNIEEPAGWFNFEAKAKYKEWNGKKGKSKDECMNLYIEKAKIIIANDNN